jgi:cysteine rich repeat protein
VRKILLTLIIATTPASFALAQHAGTSQEQRSCSRDASHFCRKNLGDDWAVQQCLMQHRNQLSRACSRTFESHGM